ncbi:hypothetical protein ATTO_12500 [Leptogranulimonas caecicola]|uniref:Uncharacterized protein n=1 Tax=Leptogranulimonas caecicola TaxID=2894156 RepID=A0AAU9CY09_9ACTN|nr:hypothetical protein ATTO_12500 [Leptogranulimonas caecicola]
MAIPGEAWRWICARSWEDVEGDLHCGRDGSPIPPRDEILRAQHCGCFLSLADKEEKKDAKDPETQPSS